MKVFTPYFISLFRLSIVLFLTTSCEGLLGRYDDKECGYTVQIRYDYNKENGSVFNELPAYVSTLTEYLFDDQGVLIDSVQVRVDECYGQYLSEYDLPPGRYTVIAIGNQSTMSEITDNGKPLEPGVTRREEMLLTLQHVVTRTDDNGDGNYNNCGRLYHGYRTFSVEPNQVSNVRVDMVHSHHVLRFRIRWKQAPPPLGDYYATMTYIPSEYTLMPQYVYPEPYKWEDYDCAIHDLFSRQPIWVKHHIPTVHQDRNILTHKLHLRRNADAEIKGEFVMYRIKNETTPTMALYMGMDATGKQQMKEINLQRYFNEQQIDLDHTLKQEYNIEIMIDATANQVHVYPITISDWEEGGIL